MPIEVDKLIADEMDRLADSAWTWFVVNTHPATGLTLDRAANGSRGKQRTIASLGGTGFYLGLLPIAVERGRLEEKTGAQRAARTMRFVLDSVDHVHGIMLHFVDWAAGRRAGKSEYSLLDTAIFLHGCIVAAQCFGGTVAALADELLERVRWENLKIIDPRSGKGIVAYGFDGATKQILRNGANVRSSENLMPCVLACGSRAHAIGSWCWENMAIVSDLPPRIHDWTPPAEAHGLLNAHHGLFTSYYGLAWMNLSGLHDPDGVDLWSNARRAAIFNRAICREVFSKSFSTYRAENGGWWGLSAGDSPDGYVVPDPLVGDHNGTVWPTAALGSFAWLPAELSEDLSSWKKSAWWPRVRGPYGVSPFSIDRDWIAPELLSIDLGSFAVNWWNARNGLIQHLWASHPIAQKGLASLQYSKPH